MILNTRHYCPSVYNEPVSDRFLLNILPFMIKDSFRFCNQPDIPEILLFRITFVLQLFRFSVLTYTLTSHSTLKHSRFQPFANYNPTFKDSASTISQKVTSLNLLYHNRTVTSSSRVVSTSQQDASSSKDIPSSVMLTEEMLLNRASVSRSSGSLVRNCAADMKSMSLSSSWYRWRMPAIQ